MKRYFCIDYQLYRGCYIPEIKTVLNAQPKPCTIYRDEAKARIVLELVDDAPPPKNFPLAGIFWKEETKP